MALLCLATIWIPACGGPSSDRAQDILKRTIPPGASMPPLSEPTRSRESLQLTWDVETQMSSTAYSDWLKTRFQDFQLVSEGGLELHLAKLTGGDAYRLHVTLQAGSGVTHAHMQLTVSPD
jgi:hypothetical protein